MSDLHISIDDTKWIFRTLTLERPKSIFDIKTLAYFLELHKRYGSQFIFYCTYMGNSFRLSATPTIYCEEFICNDWLQFGFHTYDQRLDYGSSNDMKIGRHYTDTISEIRRITGRQEYSKLIRIHKFQGSKQAAKNLKDLGVSALLTADDDRYSYYLDSKAENHLHKYGQYVDKELGLKFYCTLPRLEIAPDILKIVNEKTSDGWEILSVFTHERFLQEAAVQQKLDALCKWAIKNK